jgi:outer membrane protein assembly factor BamB
MSRLPVNLHRICPAAIILLSLLALPLPAQDHRGDWPQWRGPNRDGTASSRGLLREWPEEGPERLWHVDSVGVGYSSLAVQNGILFTQGDLAGVEHILAIDTESGKVVWKKQPAPVALVLAQRVTGEFERHDKDENKVLDEAEALAGYGWRFNQYDQKVDGTPEAVAAARVKRLMPLVDKDGNGQLTFNEVGKLFQGRGNIYSDIDQADSDADAEALAASRAAQLMATLDTDKDKVISREESRGSLLDRDFNRADERDPTTNKGDEKLTTGEIHAHLLKSAKGKDGVIHPQELATYYARKHPQGDGLMTEDELKGLFGGYRNGMGDGPRGTPTVDDERVYVEGGSGDVSCLNVKTGKTIWHRNLRENLGGGTPGWGYSESPLVEKNLLIVTPGGGKGTLVALDKMTGDEIWRTAEVTEGAHYSSPVAADIGGVRQIIQFARSSVFGVDAGTGKQLWSYNGANNGTANCTTPIIYQDHVFASSSYGKGGGLAKISVQDGKQTATEVYFDKRMANHHGGIIMIGEHMYGFGSGGLICMHYLTGEVAWRARSVGKGSLIAADGMLYLLSEGHELALAEATPEEYREHGRIRLQPHGRPSWAHMALADGILFIRDQESLSAFDVRKK